ncbi:MAG: hypothetical protein KBS65_02370 [Prevotella sp.]|nr:hypothetical protein [Candidatus Equicola stercoris]
MNRTFYYTLLYIVTFLSCFATKSMAGSGTWSSNIAGKISYKSSSATKAKKDYNGKLFTIVYLENLGFEKLGKNTNAEDVQWLRDNGFAVIELDYNKHSKAVSPYLNSDIISINAALNSGSFCGISNISPKRAYILCEGYRIKTDVGYYKDDPTVYNYPDHYKTTQGDSLYMDIIYPANADKTVPTLLSFSYSNSWGHKSSSSAIGENAHMRMYLPYTLAGSTFYDSILEGAPARGIAWAIADNPKYCEWGQGKRTGGANKEYGSISTNPDAARKVKSAVRTLRVVGNSLGLSGEIGIYGFSRGSTIGAFAVGDRYVADFEGYGNYPEVSSAIQVAILGPGVFDYTLLADGFTDKNEYKNGVKVWGELKTHKDVWNLQGANYLCETNASAPCLFFYNSDDEKFYGKTADAMKETLDRLGVTTALIKDHNSGHCVPKDETNLNKIYDFLSDHFGQASGIEEIGLSPKEPTPNPSLKGREIGKTNIQGIKVNSFSKGVIIKNGKKYLQ